MREGTPWLGDKDAAPNNLTVTLLHVCSVTAMVPTTGKHSAPEGVTLPSVGCGKVGADVTVCQGDGELGDPQRAPRLVNLKPCSPWVSWTRAGRGLGGGYVTKQLLIFASLGTTWTRSFPTTFPKAAPEVQKRPFTKQAFKEKHL